jgi:hypothetical protein
MERPLDESPPHDGGEIVWQDPKPCWHRDVGFGAGQKSVSVCHSLLA